MLYYGLIVAKQKGGYQKISFERNKGDENFGGGADLYTYIFYYLFFNISSKWWTSKNKKYVWKSLLYKNKINIYDRQIDGSKIVLFPKWRTSSFEDMKGYQGYQRYVNLKKKKLTKIWRQK